MNYKIPHKIYPMKSRISSLDLRALANELDARLSGKYIQNFYSHQQRFMYVKFSNRDVLLIEPGACAYIFTGKHETEISHFCKKLRESCRHARVKSVSQFYFDRTLIIDLTRFRIVVEFFSSGNILILDSDNQIVDLLRPVPSLGIVKGTTYVFNPVELVLSVDELCSKGLHGLLPFEKEFVAVVEQELNTRFGSVDKAMEECNRMPLEEYLHVLRARVDSLGGFGEVTLKGKNTDQFFAFKTVEEQHAYSLLRATACKDASAVKPNDSEVSELSGAVEEIALVPKAITDHKALERIKGIGSFPRDEVSECIKGKKGLKALWFPTMSEALEYAFSDKKKVQKEKKSKIERITEGQRAYIKRLESEAEAYTDAARAIEEQRRFVEDILKVFGSVYETGMQWSLFEEFLKEEKQGGNPLSLAIASYSLKDKKAIVMVEEQAVELQLDRSLNQNVADYYARARKAQDKARKTEQAMENITERLGPKTVSVKPQARVKYWFERYHWFITTDGVLVLGGKNAQENDQLVKNRLEKDDLYFHCDVQGASSVVCKGRSETAISEAAIASLCLSKCWESGIVSRVYYVNASQVSKTAPSGEFLQKGGFMLSGKKNFVEPHRLEYGLGLLFKVEGSQPLEFNGHQGGISGEIVHALPACAPWKVVKDYKYRVRLCPGSEKKSGLAKEIMRIFCGLSAGSPEEKAVKAVGIDEYMGVLIGKGKIGKIVK